MLKLEVTAKQKASKKTKDRLKDHGKFWVLQEDAFFDGKPAILVRKFQGQYMRWFFKSEVEITYLDDYRSDNR